MTTFANSLGPFANMQAPEDAMEVSTDAERKNTMAMEEDHVDIDLELNGTTQDEDSMMDDGLGQDSIDFDQQMGEDYQELVDQDDEILDYVIEQADVEVPMTEEQLDGQSPNSPSQNIFGSNPMPQLASSTQLASDHSLHNTGDMQLPNNNHRGASSTLPDLAQSEGAQADTQTSEPDKPLHGQLNSGQTKELDQTLRTESSSQGTSSTAQDNVQSSEMASQFSGYIAVAEKKADETKGTDALLTAQNSSALVPYDNDDPQDLAPANERKSPSRDEQGDGLRPVSEHEKIKVATQQDTAQSVGRTTEQSTQQGMEQAPEQIIDQATDQATDQTYEKATEESTEEPTVQEILIKNRIFADSETTDHALETATDSNLLPIVVTFQEHQMSLFPPETENGTQETYLLPDSSLAGRSILSLLGHCSRELTQSLTEVDELELSVPTLGLSFRAHHPEADQYALRDLADLHVQLQQNDGLEHYEHLRITLNIQPSLTSRINRLYDLAAQGKGLRFLSQDKLVSHNGTPTMNQQGNDISDLENDPNDGLSHELKPAPMPQQRTSDEFQDEPDQEQNDGQEFEFGDPDIPHSELDFGDFDQDPDHIEDREQPTAPASKVRDETVSLLDNTFATPLQPSGHGEVFRTTHNEGVQATGEVGSARDMIAEGKNEDKKMTQSSHREEKAYEDDGEASEFRLTEENNEADWTGEDYTNLDNYDGISSQRRFSQQQTQPSETFHDVEQAELNKGSVQVTHSPSNVSSQLVDTVTEIEQEDTNTASAAADANRSEISTFVVVTADDDIFDDDNFHDLNNAHIMSEVDNAEVDFDLDFQPSSSPSSLKRSRAAVNEAEEDEGHDLKRSKSG